MPNINASSWLLMKREEKKLFVVAVDFPMVGSLVPAQQLSLQLAAFVLIDGTGVTRQGKRLSSKSLDFLMGCKIRGDGLESTFALLLSKCNLICDENAEDFHRRKRQRNGFVMKQRSMMILQLYPAVSLQNEKDAKRRRKEEARIPPTKCQRSESNEQGDQNKRNTATAKSHSFAHCLWFDGGSRGNGQSTTSAGSGAVLYQQHKMIWRGGLFLGAATNNEAEYKGLILEQVVPGLADAASDLMQFDEIDLCHVLREENKEADQMANYAMNIKRDIDEMVDDDDDDMIEL
eukprot:763854-Hanusia_phi.AAC.1